MSDIAAARPGGVWLVNGHTLRWFDGAVFRDVIDAPAELAVVTEAPDATLWAATTDGAVLHWNGSSWSRLEPGRPNPDASINAIAVDAAGRTWVGWVQYPTPPGTGWGSRYDGSTWATFDGKDAAPLGGAVWSIAQLPGGAVWVATSGGLARFDGSSWIDETAATSDGRTTASVAGGPDGAIWVAEGDPSDGAITVNRFDGRSWSSYGPSDGLPAEAGFYTAWVEPTKEGMYVGTGAGIFRLSNGRWERTWPPMSPPTNLDLLLAVSRDELWAGGESGLWHFRDGGWTNEPIDPSDPTYVPTTLTLAPDGTLWAAGANGVAYRRAGRWTVADAGPASTIVVDGSGTAWVAGSGTWLPNGPELWTLRFDGTAWARQTVEGCPLQSLGLPVGSLAIDTTRALWVGIRRGYELGGLARFDGRTWETINEIGGAEIDGAAVLGTARDGTVWIRAQYAPVPTATQPSQTAPDLIRAARFDDEDWTTVEMPDDFWVGPTLAPDGTLWASTRRGPAHYDGKRWAFPYASISSPWTGGDAAAPDGTVFGWLGSSLLRFPSPVPGP
jgi:ligand-binding sensor domain-containing protein